MPFLIGTDEAGYAPNLGPLVISTTVWRIEGDAEDCDLYRRLRPVVSKKCPAAGAALRRLPIADSKKLYKPPFGLALLERGVLAALGLLECRPATWQDIWPLLDVESSWHLGLLPWHVDYNSPLPIEHDAEEIDRQTAKLRLGFERAGVKLIAIRSMAVFPERFNHWTCVCGNKGEALSKLTLQLVERALADCPGEPVLIICDKHGGRNRYGRLLQEQFPDPWVEVQKETMQESIYGWEDNSSADKARRVEIRFRVGGEAFLPAALSSMVSKYLRELAMRAFNHYWCGHVPDLRPTAGYPLDARRFKRAIQSAQAELGIDDGILWRSR